MRVQPLGNVNQRETSPRTRTSVSRVFVLRILAFAFLLTTGCVHNPPKDKSSNLPDGTVREFIELVQAEKYDDAQKLWYGTTFRITEAIDFEEFFSRYKEIDLDKCKISKATRGKSGFSMVNIDWEENGQKKHGSFGLKIKDGKWKMQRGYKW